MTNQLFFFFFTFTMQMGGVPTRMPSRWSRLCDTLVEGHANTYTGICAGIYNTRVLYSYESRGFGKNNIIP